MTDFFHALVNPDFPFLRYALAMGLLSSVAFGIVGAYVVVRRISYMAGAISHSILGGIGLGLFLQGNYGLKWCHPMLFAVLTALLSAIIIGYVSLRARQREDTIIGAVWAVGMALGLIFLTLTPGYVDPMSYLFGNILVIAKTDLWLIMALDILISAAGLFFFNNLQAVCFDEEFARLKGLNVDFYFIMLLVLTALTVVLMVRIVGIVLVIALLTIPAAVAGQFTTKLKRMMILSVILSAIFITIGLWLSYAVNFPSGPTIIIIAGGAYILSAVIKRGN
ncbi:metal ABC transporter permease [bacterium]|nr:metal ABC transporter permease [bacterium]